MEQEDDFNRARVELERAVIDYEMTAEEARAERRKRRERMRDSSSSSGEDDDEESEHHTRSRDAAASGVVGDAGTDAAQMPPPPPPPPLPPQAGEPETEKGTKNPFVIKVNKVEINVIKAKSGVNPSGTPGRSADAGPNSSSGPARTSANPCGAGELFGQSESLNGAYKAVFATRLSCRVNPILDEEGGMAQEKISIGSFSVNGDHRTSICHFRALMDRKMNICFSFDPLTLKCGNCPDRGSHDVDGGGSGGRGGGIRQTYILSDQNFPPAIPCTDGECLKIIRVENGSLSEIVSCFLDLMRGRGVPAGSVILLSSASHLQMMGVAGYMVDLGREFERLGSTFGGGVIGIPGVPVLLGGCDDSTAVRSILEAGIWLANSGTQHLRETLKMVATEIKANGKGGVFITEKFRHPMPLSLSNTYEQRSWVSGGWTTPRGVLPVTPEIEAKIINCLISELNSLYSLGLGTNPILDRLSKDDSTVRKVLVIGGSHARREAEIFAERGYDVVACAVGGWRPNKTAIEDMTEKVTEAVAALTEDDIVVIHCFDNVAYMARSEEGGDLPIRRYPTGDFHIEGELVLASKERLFMYFKNCMPFFKLLEKLTVFFLSPLPRHLYVSCCLREDHAPNIKVDGFEEEMRKALQDCRNNYKDFFFTSGLRNVTVLNPGAEVPQEDESGMQLWGPDPVHPLREGYERIVDLIMREDTKNLDKKHRKRSGGSLESAGKRQRFEAPRPKWIGQQNPTPNIQTGGNWMGGQRGRGGGRGRGRGPWRIMSRGGRGYQ
jgi:hypothetical protein